MTLDRPVLIAGTPRSGKTCLWRTILQDPDFVGHEEPIMIWGAAAGAGADDRRTAEGAADRARNHVIDHCERLVRTSKKRRYVDNLSYHALRLPLIHALLPEVRVIHVIRDPVDAIPEIMFGWTRRPRVATMIRHRRRNISLRAVPRLALRFARNYLFSRTQGIRETWGPAVPGLAEFVRDHSPAEIAAFQWKRLVEIPLTDLTELPGLSVLEVRHDRLVRDPRREATRIAEFIESESPQALVDYAASHLKVDYVHFEPCRVEPTPDDWRAIRRTVQPLDAELGYAASWGDANGRSATNAPGRD